MPQTKRKSARLCNCQQCIDRPEHAVKVMLEIIKAMLAELTIYHRRDRLHDPRVALMAEEIISKVEGSNAD